MFGVITGTSFSRQVRNLVKELLDSNSHFLIRIRAPYEPKLVEKSRAGSSERPELYFLERSWLCAPKALRWPRSIVHRRNAIARKLLHRLIGNVIVILTGSSPNPAGCDGSKNVTGAIFERLARSYIAVLEGSADQMGRANGYRNSFDRDTNEFSLSGGENPTGRLAKRFDTLARFEASA
jgi:hypothetical protein